MSPTTTLLAYIAVAAIFLFVGIGADQLVTWDRQVSIAAAEHRMRRAERQSEELLRAALQVSDAVQPRAIEAGPTVDHMTGELLAVDGVDTEADAPAEDTDRTGMWRVLLGLASDLVDRVHDWLPNLLRQWRERNQLGSGGPSDDEPWVLYDEDELREQGVSELELKMLREGYVRIPYDEATDAEDRASEVEAMRAAKGDGIRQVLAASGYELDIADEDELNGQRAEWVALNPPANHGPDGQRHWNDVTAMHGIVTPGRHAKMPINPVPAQRDGGDE